MSERALVGTKKAAGASAPPIAHTVLQRKCACGTHSAGGECEACKRTKRNSQRKLAMEASSDPLEGEADRAANLVTSGIAANAVGHNLSRVQHFAAEGADVVPSSVEQVLAGPGIPFQSDIREEMEQKFDYDFSRVRVHTDSAANESARHIGANAYTVDHHIVFGAGEFSPASRRGQRLIAHELAHVVQQSRAGSPVQGGENGTLSNAPLQSLNGAASSQIVQRQGSAQIEAPDIEAVADPEGVKLPVASADPRLNSDFIDRRLKAVGVGLSGADFILFCDGIPDPIALPLDYIDLDTSKSAPVDHLIYPSREVALDHVPFGPEQPGAASPFAFYRAVGGLVVPTRFSAASAPETVRLIKAAREKLKQFLKTATDTLVISVLLFIGAALGRRAISKWILPRIGAPQKLPIDESLPKPKPAATGTPTKAPVAETPTPPKTSPSEPPGILGSTPVIDLGGEGDPIGVISIGPAGPRIATARRGAGGISHGGLGNTAFSSRPVSGERRFGYNFVGDKLVVGFSSSPNVTPEAADVPAIVAAVKNSRLSYSNLMIQGKGTILHME